MSSIDLPGAAVGQTTGTSIILDTTAAGYGWYIDYTPYLNDEYLPTSNPNEWIAKPGSEAAGKMDMLSVLLHEYGHALGIEHSADSHDYMAATLAPGVRRLPSADELALMAQLVAQAKGDTPAPADPAPFDQPGAPLSNGNGSVRVTRARISRYGTTIAGEDGVFVPQYDIAANLKLTDPRLETGTGWETTGAVSIGNGAAILSETNRTQTRLNQVFLLGPTDRYLSFTVANAALDNLTGAPDDAFEAALLDANTGSSLLGVTGLTRNDAFLNLQGDGTEHVGSGVTSVLNADGSRTYRVDLSGIPAGTAVNLSFDLIGFGAATSHVTVRDIRLGGLAPETHDDTAATLEDTPIDIAATANDVDANQTGFAPMVVAGPAHGEVVVNADGSFRYTPATNWYGDDSFTYKLSDGSIDSNVATVTLTVAPVNDAPVATDIAAATPEDTAVTIDLLASASDVDSTSLTPSIVAGPQHGLLAQNADGSFTYTPDANWNGVDSFTYRVSDGELDSGIATARITVAAVNDVPIVGDFAISTSEDTPVVVDLLAHASDIDSATLTATIVASPQHGTLTANADGTWTYTPDANWNGTDSLTFRVNDGEADSAVGTLLLNVAPVNDAPVVQALSVATDEDTPLTIDLLAGASDVDSTSLTPSIVAGPQHGTLTRNADGSFTYTPDANWNGEDAFTYRVSDGELDSGIATARITVAAVNDAPVAAGFLVATQEDTPVVIDLLAHASDIDSATLTAAIVTGPQHGTLTVNADGTWTYTPDANWNGSDSLTYRVNDGEADSAIATLLLNVAPVNDAPVVQPLSVATDEDTPLVLDPLAGASDVDGDALSVVITTPPQHGSVVENADGTWTYRPAADFNGADSIGYEVSDGTVAVAASVAVTVRPVNDAPVSTDQSVAMDEDGTLRIDVLAGVHDVEGDPLTARIVSGPAHGRLELNADGSFTYRPDADFNGADGFSYVASDGQLDSAVATVRIVIAPVNDAPVVSPIAATLEEDGTIVLDLLGAAHDVDGDPLTATVGQAEHGALTQNADGTWTYRPVANYNGSDSFAWTVSDGQASATGLVRLTVTAVNDAPVANDEVATLDEDRSVTLAVMRNDVDGDALTLRIASQPTHGKLVLNADKTLTYTPAADWSGEDSFTYVQNDGQTDSNVATVKLIVAAVADAPILVLTDAGGASREIFRTGWESAPNPSSCDSTLVKQTTLEGWTRIDKPDGTCGGNNGFEIWSSGDRMANVAGQLITVNAADGDGKNWLELNDARGGMHQTLGIERSVDTLAGATYTLSMDLAGRIGYSADYTKIAIYVDGVKIGTDADTSGAKALNWQTRTFSFVGKGGAQKIRIVSEATRTDPNGRGMMIDDIALIETLPSNTGLEDSAIRLPAISAALTDIDGSETLGVAIESLPVGAVLTEGTRNFKATAGHTTADVTGWDLAKLSLLPPPDYNGSFTLKVVATATETSNGSQARTEASIVVNVLPVNDAPVAKSATFQLLENGSVRIDFGTLVSDVDGDALTLTLGKPKHGTLTRNQDGSYTYTPRRGFEGTDSFVYTVSDGKLSATATISLKVIDDDDHDHRHHDNGKHNGFDHSGHYGYPDWDDGRSCSLVVQSRMRGDDDCSFRIEWGGAAADYALPKQDDDWLADCLGLGADDRRSLAERTGLVVRVER